MDLSVVVPCFNEIENVPRLKTELLPVLAGLAIHMQLELILVDDGSTDGTLPGLQTAFANYRMIPIIIHRHVANRGLGAALRTGLSAARGDVVITTDCDGTFDFDLIPQLLQQMTPQVDIVTASPHHSRGGVVGVPGYRLLLSRGCSAVYRLLVTPRVHTYTSLFRAYRREVTTRVTFVSDGFLAGTELLVKALLAGYRVAEYPALLQARTSGSSKIQLGRTILAHLRFQGRLLLHRLSIRSLYA
jgi:dolichol-phosphate mannosyltransferase